MRRLASRDRAKEDGRRGAVLIVALWVVIVLSLMVATLAYEMHVEAKVTTYYRSRMKAQYLTLAGVEWAKMLLVKTGTNDPFLEENFPDLFVATEILRRGNAITGLRHELGEGAFIIDLIPEQGRRNVNRLTLDDWYELLERNNVPEDLWDELVDAFMDWVDKDEEHRLNGAESDDSYYEERGYEVKNAPVDTIDELVLIKGFTPEMVYGGPAEDPELPPLPRPGPVADHGGGRQDQHQRRAGGGPAFPGGHGRVCGGGHHGRPPGAGRRARHRR